MSAPPVCDNCVLLKAKFVRRLTVPPVICTEAVGWKLSVAACWKVVVPPVVIHVPVGPTDMLEPLSIVN